MTSSAARRFRAILAVAFCVIGPAAFAMEFTLVRLNDGTIAVRGEGDIVAGDAERLEAVATGASVGQHGERTLMLSSPGGYVSAAINLGDVIDAYSFMTIVGAGDSCVSACVLVYISGNARIVHEDGALYLHTCQEDDPDPAAQTFCHADIARFMGQHGYQPDMLFSGLRMAQKMPSGYLSAPADYYCNRLQQPPYLPHPEGIRAPCLQLMETGTVRQARGWERPADAGRQADRLSHPFPTAEHVVRWTPFGAWSYDQIDDGASLGYRRSGKFPFGPEIEIACLQEDSDHWVVMVARPGDAAIPAIRTLRVVADGGAWTSEVLHREPIDTGKYIGSVELFRIDTEAILGLIRAEPVADFQMLDAGHRVFDTIRTNMAGFRERIVNIDGNCVGRF